MRVNFNVYAASILYLIWLSIGSSDLGGAIDIDMTQRLIAGFLGQFSGTRP
jgi:hypothetical protein